MEHELFQSKLKPLVDGASISDIIESFSSGEHPHRTAAMELILERSIQERRERILAKIKSISPQDPAPQPRRSAETATIPTPKVVPPAPTPAPQPPSRPPFKPVPAKNEALPDTSTLVKPAKKTKAMRHEEPPADIQVNTPSSKDPVKLVCGRCDEKHRRKSLRSGIYCPECSKSSRTIMRCSRCRTPRDKKTKSCTNCRVTFK